MVVRQGGDAYLADAQSEYFFSVTELNDSFETPSACHIIYGDNDLKTEEISTAGLSSKEFGETF